MSIRKLKGEYHVCCDAPACGISINSQCRSSKTSAWGIARAKGWWARHVGPCWRHFCGKPCHDAYFGRVDSNAE